MIAVIFFSLIWSFVSPATVISSSSNVRIATVDGNTTIWLDGQQVDLSRAKLVNETSDTTILEPAESDKYNILVDKRTGRVTGVQTKDGSQMYRTNLTSEEERAIFKDFQQGFSASMDEFRKSMQDLANSFSFWK